MPTEIPQSGNPGAWPTASAINNRIAMSNRANGRTSPLTGLGEAFIQFGTQFGIHPGFVCALLQRESQLGADGSLLPTRCNNFGGNTYVEGANLQGASGRCAAASGIAGREWKQFATARAGLEGVFRNLNSQTYRATGGTAQAVISRYAPPHENDHNAIFMTFASVASNLGIRLDRNTQIYTSGGTGIPGEQLGVDIPGVDVGNPVKQFTDWIVPVAADVFTRGFLFLVGLAILSVGLWRMR